MSNFLLVPDSARAAGSNLRQAFGDPLDALSKSDFMRAWCAVAYLFPGLHPDGFENDESGWPRALKPFAVEAWRRNEQGELEDDEMYPGAAQWAGIYDRFDSPTPEESGRRLEIAVAHGEPHHG